MTRFPVSQSKEQELLSWMEQLKIGEEDLEEKFIRGSGKGGQKINTTANCVWLKHTKSGIEIKCQASRSLAMNRFLARRLLCQKVEQKTLGAKSQAEQAREKIRRQKRKRSRRAKEKILDEKQKRSETKKLRKRIERPGDYSGRE